jgi:hypothetical protein
MPAKRFGSAALKTIDATKYFYIRAGDDHRFIAIWVVVVDGRVFVRPWNDKAAGWYREFLENPIGAVKVGEKVVRVRARKVRSARLVDAVDEAYAAKYTSKANKPYVKGFATAKRQATTTELTPA